MLLPGVALAYDAQWQMEWLDDGSIREQVTIPDPDFSAYDSSWSSAQSSGNTVLTREVKNWQAYEQLAQRLPVKVKHTNYIILSVTQINPDLTKSAFLFESFDNSIIRIKVPGIISETSGTAVDDYTVQFGSSREFVGRQGVMKVVVLDGFMLGIVIVSVGLIVVLLLFGMRMRKIDRLIADEYSLEKVVLEEQRRRGDESGEPSIEAENAVVADDQEEEGKH